MSREKLILIPSETMDKNKKEDRNENGLIRMSKATRNNMEFDKNVEVYPVTTSTTKRMHGAMLLDIFHAFSSDIKMATEGGVSEDELNRVGFVTTKTYYKITGERSGNKKKNIWITDDIVDTIIGADPEFLLFNNEKEVIRANNVLSYNGLIGCDGAMAEVRPKPAITPEGLVKNIKDLLKDKKLTKPIDSYDWIAGCYYKDNVRDYPIGGHIHIGNPIKIARMDTNKRVAFFKVFNKILDELLAIPMIKIDGANMGRARRTECSIGKFGYFGEFRTCNGRLEHRTLSGMWLMHPILTTLVLGTAKAIIDEVYRHVADNDYKYPYMFPHKYNDTHIWAADFDQWTSFPLANDMNCTMDSREMVELLHKSSAAKINAKFLNSWYSRMKNLSTYSVYAKYIDGLYEILKNNTKDFHDYDHRNMQNNWLNDAKFLE